MIEGVEAQIMRVVVERRSCLLLSGTSTSWTHRVCLGGVSHLPYGQGYPGLINILSVNSELPYFFGGRE